MASFISKFFQKKTPAEIPQGSYAEQVGIGSQQLTARRWASKSRELTGKAGKFVGKTFQALSTRGGVTRASYGMPIRPPINKNKYKAGFRGRPRGSYNPLYAQYGGVYGYRKAMSHKRALERLAAKRAAQISPQQAQVLNQYQAQQYAQRQSPEGRIIPDTTGNVGIGQINNEIDDAANLFP